MTDLRFGSLFSGYGGLDMGIQSVLGGTTAWFCEFDKAPSRILAHHWPDVPNLGDITKVDWATVEPVDVLTGGSPCQDLSHAGRRAGMTEGTRSNLWVQMREAIDALRPRLVVWENVRGALSAPADSDLEPCPGCVGGPDDGPVLRALGRVLGDLSELGYDTWWTSLRAADVGAAHGRFRVFLFAWPVDAESDGLESFWGQRTIGRDVDGLHREGQAAAGVTLLGTPRASEWKGSGPVGSASHDHMLSRDYLSAQVLDLLPTPRVTQAGYADDGRGGKSLDVEARAGRILLPTPVSDNSRGLTSDSTDFQSLPNEVAYRWGSLPNEVAYRWGDYAPAIARWESVIGRPAPSPTEPGPKGNPRLSARFVEWLMGLPAGHVTDTPGLSRNHQLKALGNGVVPQQAAAATRWWLTQLKERAA